MKGRIILPTIILKQFDVLLCVEQRCHIKLAGRCLFFVLLRNDLEITQDVLARIEGDKLGLLPE